MQTESKTITPEVAKQLLLSNNNNRRVRPSKVAEYADIMRRGEWKLIHQGIAISQTGEILDGQHRLMAVVESGVSIQANISYNAPKESFALSDRMVKRDASDILRIDRRDAAVIREAIVKASDRWKSPPDSALIEVRDAIGAEIRELIEFQGSSTVFFSSANFKLGAVISMIQYPERKEEILALYAALVKGDISKLPEIAQNIYVQVAKKSLNSKMTDESFDKGLQVFNPNNWNEAKTPRSSLTSISDAKSLLRSVLKKRGVNL